MLRSSVAVAAMILVACGSSSGLDRSALTTNVCTSGQWLPTRGVVPAAPTTYFARVSIDGANARTVLDSVGTPCASAADAAACDDALRAARPTSGWRSGTCGGAGCNYTTEFFVAEHDGVVTVVDDVEKLRSAIAPVDGAEEAVLLAKYRYGGSAECSGPQARPVGGGAWEVIVATGDGQCTDRSEYLVRVAADGTMILVDSTYRKAKETCLYP